MKKLLSILFMLLSANMFSHAACEELVPVELELHWNDPGAGEDPPTKQPVPWPSIAIDGHTLYFLTAHDEYVVQLLCNGIVVYSMPAPQTTTLVSIPSSLTGDYELRLLSDGWYFSSVISL